MHTVIRLPTMDRVLGRLRTENWELPLDLRLGPKLNLSALSFNRVLNCFAAVLFAQFAGLFLDEGRERIEVARNLFSRFLLGSGQHPVERFDLPLLIRSARV